MLSHLSSLIFFAVAHAAEIVVPENVITALPGPADPLTSGVGGAVQNFYFLALLGASLFAFGIIIYAGIKYTLSAGKSDMQTDARDRIVSALWGILLLFGAYTILYTINPELVNLTLPTLKPPTNVPTFTGDPNVPPAGASNLTGVQVQAQLTAACTNARLPANCIGVSASAGGVTRLAGLRQATIDEVVRIKTACDRFTSGNCNIVITGGTEPGHDSGTCSHETGYKVDIRASGDVTSYIRGTYRSIGTRSDGARQWQNGSIIYALEPGHWDIKVGC